MTTGSFPMAALDRPEILKLTILHTNDVHSRIEAFPSGSGRLADKGGAARRASLIQKIRAEEKHVLLMDAGDIFQGTPYFNFFGGELEFKLMSEMGYDVATIGNHDFDAGIEGLVKQMPLADFPFVSSNYRFEDTALFSKVKAYKVFQAEQFKIGVFGLGIELRGLVPDELYKGIRYEDPVKIADRTAAFLKAKLGCDYVICLSHLGYHYKDNTIDDVKLAALTTNIDLIIGGHTHTFLDKAEVHKNKNQEPVLINQVGWAGLMLGRIDVYFERNKKGRCENCKNEWIS